MPIYQENHDNNKSVVADISNCPKTRFGGAGNAAAFLTNFIEEGV